MKPGIDEHTATTSSLDLELIRKYSIAGPRYTSYPPATRFEAGVERSALLAAIARDNASADAPLSLYFHLPFCKSLCYYCGCNSIITKNPIAAIEYLGDLAREVALVRPLMNRARPVRQVHLGGGTPTFLTPEELGILGRLIRDNFTLADDCEFGVEIDPRCLDEAQVAALKAIGANRASLGVQDTNPDVQLAIHRWQPHDLNRRAVDWLRGAGFTSINFDLIYGLPLQTRDSFLRTIDDVLELHPDRLSVFSYAHVPWIRPAQRQFERRHQLCTPEEKLAIFAAGHERLLGAGFIDIGLDHFARPDDELAIAQREGTLQRNFQGYSTAAGASLYGFGVSSISSTEDSYRQSHKTLEDWRRDIAAGALPVERGLILTEDDRRRRAIIMHLMCDRRVDYAALSRQLGIDVTGYFAAEISGLLDLEADGLLRRTETGIEMLPRGFPLLRVAAMRFDATAAPAGRHSMTV